MKNTSPMLTVRLTLILVLALALPLNANENQSDDSWRTLSAHCQNLYHAILTRSRQQKVPVGVDMALFEENLDGIEKALDALVKSGQVESRLVQLKDIKDMEDERLGMALDPVIERLTKKYGVYVASEMSGIGEHMRFLDSRKVRTPLKLHIRLPKDDMQMILASLYKNDLVANERPEGVAR